MEKYCPFLVLLIVYLCCQSQVAYCQQPAGNPIEKITVTVGANSKPIRFIRLPRLDNIHPLVTGKAGKQIYPMGAAYLAEMEMSLGAVKGVLSPASWDRYKRRVIKYLGLEKEEDLVNKKNIAYRQAILEGSHDYPAVCLSFKEIIEICKTLNASSVFKELTINSEFETLSFRLPSRMEWQLAARGLVAFDKERWKQNEHFPDWIDYKDVTPNVRGKIEELQERLDLPINLRNVENQEAFLSLGDKAYPKDKADANGKSLRALFADIFCQLMQAARIHDINIGAPAQRGYSPCKTKHINPLGFHRLLGNVQEWVLYSTAAHPQQQTLETVQSQWKTLIEANDIESIKDAEIGITMGGSYEQIPEVSKEKYSKWQKHPYRKYSIKNGYPDPSDPDFGRKPEKSPFKVSNSTPQEGVKRTVADLASRYEPGLRLLCARRLSPNWFTKLRKLTFLNANMRGVESTEDLQSITDPIAATIREISIPKDVETHVGLVEFYRDFTTSGADLSPSQWQTLSQKLISFTLPLPKMTLKSKPKKRKSFFDIDRDESNDENEESSGGNKNQTDFFAITHEIAVLDAAVQH